MHETVELSAPEIPLRIEFSRTAMERIRERAQEGLRALPRVGTGVGGLLLGVRQDGKIHLLDSVEIPCSHTNGPSFHLTEAERRKSIELLAEPGKAGASPIGWYCSKTRGDAVLNEFDLKFFDELLPGAGQIALIARPSPAAPMRAVFYFRAAGGAVVKACECEVEVWHPAAEEEGEKSAEREAFEPEKPKITVAEVVPPPAKAVETPKPGLEPPAPRRQGSVLGWVLGAAAVAVACGALFVIRDSWMPRPPLTLNSAQSNGHLTIRWNADALRGIDRASLYVNDGGSLQTLPLDRLQLNSGFLTYAPKSQRVTAKLDAGGTTAITAWFAPEPPTAPAAETQAPATPAAQPLAATPEKVGIPSPQVPPPSPPKPAPVAN